MTAIRLRGSPVNLLIVCSQSPDSQVVETVLQHESDGKFLLQSDDINLRYCSKWRPKSKGHPFLTVALASQKSSDVHSCSERLTELSSRYQPELLVMLGRCSSVEVEHSVVEHGCVFIAKKAAISRGTKHGEKYEVEAEYAEVSGKMMTLMNEFVHRESPEWSKLVPSDMQCPSPRYAREIVLDIIISEPDGITKKSVLERCQKLKGFSGFGAMSNMTWASIIKCLVNEKEWIEETGEHGDVLKATKQGHKYSRNAHEGIFPKRDSPSLIFETIGTVDHPSVMTPADTENLRRRMGANRLMAVDKDAYRFMKEAKTLFPEAHYVVIKGVTDHYTEEQPINCYEKFVVASSAAFLKYFISNVHQLLFKNIVTSPVGELRIDFSNDANISCLLTAVKNYASSRAFVIGLEMGFSLDEVSCLLHATVEPQDHISILFQTKAKDGRREAAVKLLTACRQVDERIYQSVVKQLLTVRHH